MLVSGECVAIGVESAIGVELAIGVDLRNKSFVIMYRKQFCNSCKLFLYNYVQ